MNGSPIIKTRDEIDKMRASGRILAAIMREVSAIVRPGITTGEIDAAARSLMARHGVKSSFLGYAPWGKSGYPAVICISVDDQVVHGIPGGRVLKEGEIVSLDCGVKLDGWHSDMAVTLPVGQITERKRRLIDACRTALWCGIREVRVASTLGAVARAIEAAAGGKYGIVKGYGGHGIGRSLHEQPFVPNCQGQPFEDLRIQEGMVLALEPMLNLGGPDVREDRDGWTVLASDGLASAHFEHTVAVVDGRFEVLTIENMDT